MLLGLENRYVACPSWGVSTTIALSRSYIGNLGFSSQF